MIIGFLAGLWFAPIVETHLTAVFLMVMLPLSILLTGLAWFCLPKAITSRFANGWHALILIPVLIITVITVFAGGNGIEALLFDGDIRTFLASYGIDFDQRNALVVGFAMGFMVIPTIFTIAEDAIFSVPKHLSDGSLALGCNSVADSDLRCAAHRKSWYIFSRHDVGLGRAVGETMIVLMATGNTPILDWNILEGMRTPSLRLPSNYQSQKLAVLISDYCS